MSDDNDLVVVEPSRKRSFLRRAARGASRAVAVGALLAFTAGLAVVAGSGGCSCGSKEDDDGWDERKIRRAARRMRRICDEEDEVELLPADNARPRSKKNAANTPAVWSAPAPKKSAEERVKEKIAAAKARVQGVRDVEGMVDELSFMDSDQRERFKRELREQILTGGYEDEGRVLGASYEFNSRGLR